MFPVNKCVILDIDATLLYTADDNSDYEKFLRGIKSPYLRRRVYDFSQPSKYTEKRGKGSTFPIVGVTRPGLDEFLDFCFNYFSIVTIWSSGTKDYVDGIVTRIFGNIGTPNVVYSRNDCIITGDNRHKPIAEMIRRENGFDGEMTLENTLLIDDLDTNAIDNPDNILLIPEYEPEMSEVGIMKPDDAFDKIKAWLLQPEVMSSKDIRKLKKNIF